MSALWLVFKLLQAQQCFASASFCALRVQHLLVRGLPFMMDVDNLPGWTHKQSLQLLQ